jgi:hypothetical protein
MDDHKYILSVSMVVQPAKYHDMLERFTAFTRTLGVEDFENANLNVLLTDAEPPAELQKHDFRGIEVFKRVLHNHGLSEERLEDSVLEDLRLYGILLRDG